MSERKPGLWARFGAFLKRRSPILVLFAGVGGGIIFWGGFNTAMEETNTMEFCLACHEMRDTVYEEIGRAHV